MVLERARSMPCSFGASWAASSDDPPIFKSSAQTRTMPPNTLRPASLRGSILVLPTSPRWEWRAPVGGVPGENQQYRGLKISVVLYQDATYIWRSFVLCPVSWRSGYSVQA